ncbi:Protein of unknown function [Pyronema omphalodes CBS 100304]|uniref:Uncharacterized protein n=1 Tax=Pyronema omphalodes (strain CBS 100304) TaxID=1076935 RepID=U4L8E2_PYROM|nr:Protein of unknown function [Pyronema omphalodes CBS 100304]
MGSSLEMLQIILFAWRDDDVGPTWGVSGGMLGWNAITG